MATQVKVVREILSRLLNVNARAIELVDEPISPDFIPQNNCGHSWWGGATKHSDLISGYSFEQGLVKFEDIVREYSYYQNGEAYHRDGEKLHEYFERNGFDQSKFQFIVVQYDGKEYGENGERYSGVKIYKSPDFKSRWAALEAADLERWEKWLNN